MNVPGTARLVVVGGGMAGCSLAYHVTRLGWTDVVLVERDRVTSGATWHAAGLCTQFHWSPPLVVVLGRSLAAYRALDAAVPAGVGLHPVGSLRLAADPHEVAVLAAALERGREEGLEGAILSRAQTLARWPLLAPDGIAGALHIPAEGYVDPASAAGAFARAAGEAGATLLQGVAATGIEAAPGGWRVATTAGAITAPRVAIAGGLWSHGLAEALGVRLPMVAMEHQHCLTGPVAGLSRGAAELPVLRDPSASFYIRQDQLGFLCGPFEPDPVVVPAAEAADQGPFQLRRAAPERLTRGLAAAMRRLPVLATVGIRQVVAGADGYTPDGLPLVGEWPGLPGIVWLTGMSLFGIAFGAGLGALVAEDLVGDTRPAALRGLAPNRFGTGADAAELAGRARATYAAEYRAPSPDGPGGLDAPG